MQVLASYNVKGGVGKTATVVNLAHQAAGAGARTLSALWREIVARLTTAGATLRACRRAHR